MNEHQISELLKISMSSIREIVDVNIIIGDSIALGEAIVIPVSKVKCGFISGGIDQKRSRNTVDDTMPFGGGAGGNVTITPVAFLVYNNQDVKVLHLEESSHILEKLIDLVPDTFNKIMSMVKKEQKPTVYTVEK